MQQKYVCSPNKGKTLKCVCAIGRNICNDKRIKRLNLLLGRFHVMIRKYLQADNQKIDNWNEFARVVYQFKAHI